MSEEEKPNKKGERSYSKSRFCDCCLSPTTSQEASDIEKEDYDSGIDDPCACSDEQREASDIEKEDSDSGTDDPYACSEEQWAEYSKSFRLKSLVHSESSDDDTSQDNGNVTTTSAAVTHTPFSQRCVSSSSCSQKISKPDSPKNSSSCSDKPKKKTCNFTKNHRFKTKDSAFMTRIKKEQSEIYQMINTENKKNVKAFKKKLLDDDNLDQSTMTQHFTSSSKITRRSNYSYVPVKTQRKLDLHKKEALLKAIKSSPFQSDDELDISELLVESRKRDFQEFLDKNEDEMKEYEMYSLKKPHKSAEELSGKRYCKLCNNEKMLCHDVLLGPYCRDVFKRYCKEQFPKQPDLLAAKKVFLNAYNNYREIKEHEFSRFLDFPKRQRQLPECVSVHTFRRCVNWFEDQKKQDDSSKR